MKNFKSVISLIILTCTTLASQQKSSYSIDGIVLNKEKLPIKFSIVSIFSILDSVQIDQKLTDDRGHFSFSQLKANDYFLKLNTFSKAIIIVPKIQIIDQDLNIGELIIEIESIHLAEVEIKSNKPFLKRDADHISLNIKDTYLAKSAYQTFEILNLIPNVSANYNNINIKNFSSILYLIDGKGNKFSNEINKLRILNLANSDIDRIEVYSNPPARFDADGFSVINVITIKNFKISSVYSNGSIGVFQNNLMSNSYSFSPGVNLNYKYRDIGLYCNALYKTSREVKTNLRKIEYNLQNSEIQSISTRIANSPFISINLGLNYKINKKGEFTCDYRYDSNSLLDSSKTKSYESLSYITKGIVDRNAVANTLRNGFFNFKNLNFGYWYNNKSFNSDFQIYYDNSSISEQGLGYFTSSSTYLNSQLKNNYATVFNLRDSINKKVEFRFGLKSSFTNSNEEINNFLNIGEFKYSENTNSLYTQMSGKVFSFLWNIGMRFESTTWKINEPKIESGFYSYLFPSLFLNKNLNGITFNLSYAKRIQRQNITELNPLTKFNDRLLTTSSGDIKVFKPQIFESYEFNIDFKKFSINMYLNRNLNPRIFYPSQIDSSIIKYEPQSSKYENTFGFNMNLPITIRTFNINIKWYNNLIRSQLLDQKIAEGYLSIISANLNYQFHNFSISGSINYTFPNKANYYQNTSYWVSNVGINYQTNSKPISIRLTLFDVLGRNSTFKINYPLVSELYTNLSYDRAIHLGLRYNFKLGKEFTKKSFDGLSR
ncbi:MAG: outer membrane beta-barrel protein [Saprospiraceae bacterium]|nr:outer membrane beta-barrel protein [Candidatus Defluviibacterium haderslevense]